MPWVIGTGGDGAVYVTLEEGVVLWGLSTGAVRMYWRGAVQSCLLVVRGARGGGLEL